MTMSTVPMTVPPRSGAIDGRRAAWDGWMTSMWPSSGARAASVDGRTGVSDCGRWDHERTPDRTSPDRAAARGLVLGRTAPVGWRAPDPRTIAGPSRRNASSRSGCSVPTVTRDPQPDARHQAGGRPGSVRRSWPSSLLLSAVAPAWAGPGPTRLSDPSASPRSGTTDDDRGDHRRIPESRGIARQLGTRDGRRVGTHDGQDEWHRLEAGRDIPLGGAVAGRFARHLDRRPMSRDRFSDTISAGTVTISVRRRRRSRPRARHPARRRGRPPRPTPAPHAEADTRHRSRPRRPPTPTATPTRRRRPRPRLPHQARPPAHR